MIRKKATGKKLLALLTFAVMLGTILSGCGGTDEKKEVNDVSGNSLFVITSTSVMERS